MSSYDRRPENENADPRPRIGAHIRKVASIENGGKGSGTRAQAEVGASDLQASLLSVMGDLETRGVRRGIVAGEPAGLQRLMDEGCLARLPRACEHLEESATLPDARQHGGEHGTAIHDTSEARYPQRAKQVYKLLRILSKYTHDHAGCHTLS